MLRRIKITGYKSLNNVEVTLQPLSVLLGPNAAGKSNFLDALQLLSKIATSRTLKEAFAPPYRGAPLESFTFDANGVKGLLEKESSSFSMEADIELSPAVIDAVNRQIREMKKTKPVDNSTEKTANEKNLSFVHEKYLRYRIEVEILPKSGFLRVVDEYLAALTIKGEPTGKRRPFLEQMHERLHLRMEGQAHPTYYERYLDHSILSLPLYPPHYPHLVAIRKELENWFFFYFEPRERMRIPNPVKEVRHIGLMGEDLAAFLNTLKSLDPLQFKAVEKALHTIIPSITGIDVQVNNIGQIEFQLLEGGTPIPARIISEGTLRLLGLLALGGAKDLPTLVGFEEPENGIHPRRIRLIAELLKNRALDSQFIVTTHSPILPDFIPDESLYICKRKDSNTVIEPFISALGEFTRRNDIDYALNYDEEELSISERILRGDFDA